MSTETTDFHVVFIGAGFAMFGTPEGPWNISARLEEKLGRRLKVDCVIDVDRKKGVAALELKAESSAAPAYKDSVVLSSIGEWAERIDKKEGVKPQAIFVATPAMFRGGTSQGRDQEIQINRYFPDVPIFLEKPVATGSPFQQSIEEVNEVARTLRKSRHPTVSVGYFLRYLQAVREMKKILRENNLQVMATNARYVTAYELATKATWWDKSVYQGPIIEQGTHLCDLSRYLAGEVDMESIHAHALEAYEKPAQLSKTNFDESGIPEEHRIPRATSATWKYESGAVGTFLHATALHGKDYAVELEVYADGYQLILADPYGKPALHVRRPGSDTQQSAVARVLSAGGCIIDEDPYYVEISNFVDAIEGGPHPDILCDYEDAARTYEMTWRIRNSSEESSRHTRERRARASARAHS